MVLNQEVPDLHTVKLALAATWRLDYTRAREPGWGPAGEIRPCPSSRFGWLGLGCSGLE